MKRVTERCYPYIISTIVCIILWLNVNSTFEVNRLEFILNSVITFSVTYIGFVITSITILIGFSKKSIFKILNKNNYTDLIVEYFMTSIIIGTMLVILSFCLGLSVGPQNLVSKFQALLFVWLFLSFLLCLIRIASFMMKIFKILQMDLDEKKETVAQPKSIPFSNKNSNNN